MPTLKTFVRSKAQYAHVRYRLTDGYFDLYYKSPIIVEVAEFDCAKGRFKRGAKISPADRDETERRIQETGMRIVQLYSKHKPRTTPELTALMDAGGLSGLLNPFFDTFIAGSRLSPSRIKSYKAMQHNLAEYEKNTKKQLRLDDTNEKDLAGFYAFMLNEKGCSGNYAAACLKKLRAVCNYAVKIEKTTNYPFAKFKIPAEVYGTPQYLTADERNALYQYDLSTLPKLAKQRDIFVFQCLTGLRVGNLLELTADNVNNGYLEYIPKKTINERADIVRVPLHPMALEILERYRGDKGCRGRLLPFISAQKYNEAIKAACEIAGLNRIITILNPRTRAEEKHPLYEVASSHMARRTFIGNLYKQIKDPNIISSMSGHCEGSKAFARYRAIDDDVKQSVIKLL